MTSLSPFASSLLFGSALIGRHINISWTKEKGSTASASSSSSSAVTSHTSSSSSSSSKSSSSIVTAAGLVIDFRAATQSAPNAGSLGSQGGEILVQLEDSSLEWIELDGFFATAASKKALLKQQQQLTISSSTASSALKQQKKLSEQPLAGAIGTIDIGSSSSSLSLTSAVSTLQSSSLLPLPIVESHKSLFSSQSSSSSAAAAAPSPLSSVSYMVLTRPVWVKTKGSPWWPGYQSLFSGRSSEESKKQLGARVAIVEFPDE